jgi:hypothetical protein
MGLDFSQRGFNKRKIPAREIFQQEKDSDKGKIPARE